MTEKQTDKTETTAGALERYEERNPPSTIPAIPKEGSPTDIVMAAIQKNYDPTFIEKMMDLQIRYEKREAEKLFFQSFADFKKQPIEVIKDKFNKQTQSHYVSAGKFLGIVNPELGKYGFAARFEIDDKSNPDLITVACILSHRNGHTIKAEMSARPDTVGPKGEPNKTEIHGRMSAFTYLMKATFSAVTGIAVIDNGFDDDGNKAGKETITETQLTDINTLKTDLLKSKKIKDDADFKIRLKRLFNEDDLKKFTKNQANKLIKKLTEINK